MLIEILNDLGKVICAHNHPNNTLLITVSMALSAGKRLASAVLRKADLRGLKAQNAKLYDADLSGADLSGADLTGADLTDAVLCGVDLTNANLNHAVLCGVDLTNADLTGADLTCADLTNASLTGVNLTGATLTGVIGTSIYALVVQPISIQSPIAPPIPTTGRMSHSNSAPIVALEIKNDLVGDAFDEAGSEVAADIIKAAAVFTAASAAWADLTNAEQERIRKLLTFRSGARECRISVAGYRTAADGTRKYAPPSTATRHAVWVSYLDGTCSVELMSVSSEEVAAQLSSVLASVNPGVAMQVKYDAVGISRYSVEA